MVIHDFDIKNLNELVSSGVVVLDFYADWCGPCKMLAPELDIVSKNNSDIKIYKINVDKNPDVARSYGIMSIPTLILYKDGKIIKQTLGYMPSDELDDWIKGA